MNFLDCIDSNMETLRISRNKGDEAKAAYEAAYERFKAAGESEAEAARKAGMEALDEITELTQTRRHQKLKEIQAAHSLTQAFKNSDDSARTLITQMENVEAAYDTVRSFAFARIAQMLQKYKPRAFRGSTTAGLDDIVRAMDGSSKDAETAAYAEALSEMYEDLRLWANSYGASIPKGQKFYLPQTQDAAKVSRVEKDVWVKDHIDALDWEVMRFDGKKIPKENRAEILGRTYDGIISDGVLREKYLQEGNVPNMANRLNRDRFLHFKDADTWIRMNESYGAGNLFEQTIGMVDAMAKDISLMRTFGPSPDSMREFAKRLSERRAALIAKEKGKNVNKATNDIKRQVGVFDDMYKIHARHVTTADGNLIVQALSATRTVAVSAQLGQVLIPSFFGDMGNAKFARQFHKMPVSGVLRNYFAEGAKGEQGMREAAQLGVILENNIGLAHSRIRYFGALDGPHGARVFGDQVYRIGLASLHTQLARNAEGKQFLGFLANTKNLKFDDHPLAAAMLELGITESDWNIMRRWGNTKVSGAEFLVPLDMFRHGDAGERQVAEKFSDMMQNYIRMAVPDPGLRARRAMGEAVDPNSAVGQMWRITTSLMSFPVGVMFNQLRSIARAPRVRDKVFLGASYFLWLTTAGAAITQAKAFVSNGQQLHDMTTADFFWRSVINGGSMGILGDLVMDNLNVLDRNYNSSDPTTELASSMRRLTVDNLLDYAKGEDVKLASDLAKAGDALVPDFWHTKLIWERAIEDAMMQEIDPAGYRSMLRYEREHEEGMWWGTGKEPEAIRPETAIGDY